MLSIGKNHIVLDRRKFLAGASALVALGIFPKNVFALAEQYYFEQGDYTVTVVSDGELTLPLSIFPDADPVELAKLLGDMAKDNNFHPQASPLLLESENDVILIDTGSGGGFQPTAGKLIESLKLAEIEPSDVTKVVFTHAHPDHCWGTINADGKPNYPNATFYMAETEWNFWTAKDLASKMPAAMEGMVKGTQSQLAVLDGKIKLFKPGAEVLPGIAVIDTAGHTPGHVSFEMAGDDGLIVTGDAITNPMVFFAHPEWKFGFDSDHDTAIKNRKKLLEMGSEGKKKMLGFHWPYPGLGHVEEGGEGKYRYVPV